MAANRKRKPAPKYSERTLAVLRQLFSQYAGVEERRMFGYPAFFTRGRMFACLHREGLGLKLSADRVAALLRRENCIPFRPHGRLMAQWVEIRHECAQDYRSDIADLRRSMRFVSRLASEREQPQ